MTNLQSRYYLIFQIKTQGCIISLVFLTQPLWLWFCRAIWCPISLPRALKKKDYLSLETKAQSHRAQIGMDLERCQRFWVGYSGTHGRQPCMIVQVAYCTNPEGAGHIKVHVNAASWIYQPCPSPVSFQRRLQTPWLSNKPQGSKRISDQGNTVHLTPLGPRCSFLFCSLHSDPGIHLSPLSAYLVPQGVDVKVEWDVHHQTTMAHKSSPDWYTKPKTLLISAQINAT